MNKGETSSSQCSCAIKWQYFEQPKALKTFDYKIKEPVLISFENIIPYDCAVKKIKLILFLRTGSEQNATFRTKVEIRNKGEKFVHWTYGQRYPQSAISYNSETIEVPCTDSRDLYVSSNHVQPTNCHSMQFFIAAVGK